MQNKMKTELNTIKVLSNKILGKSTYKLSFNKDDIFDDNHNSIKLFDCFDKMACFLKDEIDKSIEKEFAFYGKENIKTDDDWEGVTVLDEKEMFDEKKIIEENLCFWMDGEQGELMTETIYVFDGDQPKIQIEVY